MLPNVLLSLLIKIIPSIKDQSPNIGNTNIELRNNKNPTASNKVVNPGISFKGILVRKTIMVPTKKTKEVGKEDINKYMIFIKFVCQQDTRIDT